MRPSISDSVSALLAALPLLLSGACASPGAVAPAPPGPSAEPESPRAPTTPSPLPVLDVPDLSKRALLLMLADRRVWEPIAVAQARQGGPALRAELARTLGWIGAPEGRPILRELLFDDAIEVRRDAAFALGELEQTLATAAGRPAGETDETGERDPGAIAAERALLLAAAGEDSELGVLAVEAAAKLGTPLARVEEALAPLGAEAAAARLLPHLFRFGDPRKVPVAAAHLAVADPELHAGAAYALARDALPEAAPHLRPLLDDADPWVRAWAARGLGDVGDAGDLPRLRALLGAALAVAPGVDGASEGAPAPRAGDPSGTPSTVSPDEAPAVLRTSPAAPGWSAPAGVAIQALRAGAARARAAMAERPGLPVAERDAWEDLLLALLDDPRPHVRLTALAAADAFLLPETALAQELLTRAARPRTTPATETSGSAAAAADAPSTLGRREREAALVALARAGHPRAQVLASEAATSSDPWLRAAAATAAGEIEEVGSLEILERLTHDPEPRVRIAAATAFLAGDLLLDDEKAELAAELLNDTDPGVAATLFGWLAERPVVPLERLGEAVALSLAATEVEASLAGVDALAARALAEPLERGAIVALLERLAEHPRFVVRRRAAAALGRLGRPVPEVGAAERKGVGVYESILQRTREPRRVEIRTARGPVRLSLDCPRAPMTCLSFLSLASQGFFDGLTFHRVVPDFVVQGGDPRGDGFGGPAFTLRDEINRRRYSTGVLGMALAGADTGSSQFFVTLSPQPHLDGGYTAFGEVVSGFEVLERLVPGDRIETVVEVGE